MSVNYKKLVKPDTFIGQYMSYMDTQETPYSYDFWSAIWLLSCSMGRGIIISRPRAPVFMNWYIILAAESGTTRKSTAVRTASNVLQRFLVKSQLETTIIQSRITPEQLEIILHNQTKEHGHAYAAIAISELATFLGRERYVSQMPVLLTDLYDCAELRRGGGTINRGETIIKNLYVNFLSASTPSWLVRAVNPDVIEGGFTSRIALIVENKRKKSIAWPEQSVGEQETEDKLSDALVRLQKLGRSVESIEINVKAKSRFAKWYKTRSESFDPYRSSFESREDSHVLRLAGCFAINDERWIIEANDIARSTKIISELKQKGAQVFEGIYSIDAELIAIDKLRSKLLEAGISGLRQSVLTKALQHDLPAKETTLILDIMHELGMVDLFVPKLNTRGRPVKLWRATKKLTDPKVAEALLGKLTQKG